MTPTLSQQRAIEASTRGDVCVVAGPGSGKTTVLVERFSWLVASQGVRPDEIAAITFTEKAAASMLERLVARSGPENRRAYQLAQVSTIHAFCTRLLREHALDADLDPAFEVIDAWEAEIQLRRSVAAVLDRSFLSGPRSCSHVSQEFLRLRRLRRRNGIIRCSQGDRRDLQRDARMGRPARRGRCRRGFLSVPARREEVAGRNAQRSGPRLSRVQAALWVARLLRPTAGND